MNRQILLLISFFAVSSNSYGFDLFDPDRGKPPPPPPKTIKPPPSPKSLPNPFSQSRATSPRKKFSRKKPRPPQKDFSLKGTSLIGSKRAAILKGPDGKEFVQFLKDNKRTPIKNYANYHLLKVEPGLVRIEYPTESPCEKSNDKKGLKCDNGAAILSLMSQKALPPRKLPQPATTPKPATNKNEAETNKRRKAYQGFKKRVIKDEDVPPGMRVIRTPFGDRLVPIK